MTCETYKNVNYSLIDDHYIVGINNSAGSGLFSKTFDGEITIPPTLNGKDILEIGAYAFQNCLITKVTIHSKLRIINQYSFINCRKLTYIYIPPTVTFIGYAGISLASTGPETIDLEATIEFGPGTKNIFIGIHNFAKRSYYLIIYPSNIKPTYSSTSAFYSTPNYCILAFDSFDFYTKKTIRIDPIQYFSKRSHTCRICMKHKNIGMISIMISFSSS